MRVMAFASQKGGSGKTTLAGHIAVQAERAGAGPVAIIDTDPQGSLADWWNARQAPTPVFAQTFISRLAQDLQKMRDVGIVENLDKSFVFVLNGAMPRARITAEAAIALSQHGTVAPVTIHNRTEFASSMIDGRTVMELTGNRRSVEEITQLWSYLADRLDRCTRPRESRSYPGPAAHNRPLAAYNGPAEETA